MQVRCQGPVRRQGRAQRGCSRRTSWRGERCGAALGRPGWDVWEGRPGRSARSSCTWLAPTGKITTRAMWYRHRDRPADNHTDSAKNMRFATTASRAWPAQNLPGVRGDRWRRAWRWPTDWAGRPGACEERAVKGPRLGRRRGHPCAFCMAAAIICVWSLRLQICPGTCGFVRGTVMGCCVGPGLRLGGDVCELVLWMPARCINGSSAGRWSWCSGETLPGGVGGWPPAPGRV